MRSLQSLAQARRNPLWRQLRVLHHDQIPINDVPAEPLGIVPHALWGYDKWSNYLVPFGTSRIRPSDVNDPQYQFSFKTYNRMYPALQIATLCLHRAENFFVLLNECPVLSKPNMFNPRWQPNGEQSRRSLHANLNRLALTYRIFRCPVSAFPMSRWAFTSSAQDPDNPREFKIYCSVAEQLIKEIEDDSWLDKSEVQKRHLLFSLAITLVHELSHAVRWFARHGNSAIALPEPRVWPESFHELGSSAIQFLFGGDIEPHKGDWSKYLVMYIDCSPSLDKSLHVPYYIAVESIGLLFEKRGWLTDEQTFYLFPHLDDSNNRICWPYEHNGHNCIVPGEESDSDDQDDLARRALGPGLTDLIINANPLN